MKYNTGTIRSSSNSNNDPGNSRENNFVTATYEISECLSSRQKLNSPYKGLNPYTEADANIFFGRDKDIHAIVNSLLAWRLTILHGKSGVGKSSILRAGVTHILHEEARQNLENYEFPKLAVVVFPPLEGKFSWKDDPLSALKHEIKETIDKSEWGLQTPEENSSFEETLRWWTTALGDEYDCGKLYIILDQFEEYFLYHEANIGEDDFSRALCQAVTCPDLAVNFLLSLREDSLATLESLSQKIPDLFTHRVKINYLDEYAAKEAIQKPIDYYNQQHSDPIAIEQELIQAILEDVQVGKVKLSDSGIGGIDIKINPSNKIQIETPFLQLVMTRLWEEERQNDSCVLRLSTYRKLGQADQIVKAHLNRQMQQLTKQEKQIAVDTFHYLVTALGTKYSYSAPDLSELTNHHEDEIRALLEKLALGQHRILRTEGRSKADQVKTQRFVIFHDSLAPAIVSWRRRYKEHEERRAAIREQRSKLRKRARRFMSLTALGTAVIIGSIGVLSVAERQEAVRAGEQRLVSLEAIQQAETGSQLEALLRAMGVAQTVRRDHLQSAKPSTNLALQQILSSIQEQNRFSATRDNFPTASQSILSDSGNLAATASLEGQITLWDIAGGKILTAFQAHQGPVIKFQFLADQDRLASAGLDGTATIWDQNGKPITTFQAPDDVGWIVGFSPDGNRLAASSLDGTLTVWPFQGERLASFPNAHDGWILNANFSTDGQLLATTGGSTVKLWNIREQKLLHEYTSEGAVFFVEFSSDGQYLITAGDEGLITRWSVETGQRVDFQNTQQGPIYFLGGQFEDQLTSAVSSKTPTRATASSDGTVSLWNNQGNRLSSLRGHENVVQGISFGQNNQVTTITQNGTVRQWKLQQRAGFPAYETLLLRAQIKYSPNGQSLITSAEKGIKQWQLPIENEQQPPTITSAGIGMGSRFDAGGNLWFVATTQDGQTAFVQTRLQKTSPVSLQSTLGRFWYADLSPDLKWLATTSSDGAEGIAQIWDLQDPGQSPRELDHPERNFIASVAFSPDGQRLATATLDGFVHLWDMAKLEQPLRRFQVAGSYATDLEFDVDGTRLAIALADNSVQLRDVRGGLIQVFQAHKAQVRSVHFSTDGQWLLTSSLDGTARLWDMQGNQWAEYPGRDNSGVLDAAFSPDGTQIATITLDGYVEVWPVEDFDQLVTQGCNWLDDFLKIHSEEQEALSEICPP